MALKAMTLTAGPNATNGQFGFRVTAGTEENSKSGKLTFTDKPQRIELLSALARKVNLEKQLAELVRAKYLTLVSKEEADAKGSK